MRLEAVKPPALAGAPSPVRFVAQQLVAADADIVANSYGKGVDDVAGAGV